LGVQINFLLSISGINDFIESRLHGFCFFSQLSDKWLKENDGDHFID